MTSNIEKEINKFTSKSSQQQKSSWMETLPREVYFHILAKLPISSLLECKLVSKHWCASVKEPMFTQMHLKHIAENQELCLIIFSDWPKCKPQIANLGSVVISDPERLKELKMPFESILQDFEIVGSCNGLVCLYNYVLNDPLYIYNPFTTECRELAKLSSDSQSNVCRVVFGFGFHSVMNQYKAIKILYYKMRNNDFSGGNPEAFVLTLGTSTWRNIGKIPYELCGPISEAEIDGKLHWMTYFLHLGEVNYRDIVSFDMETEEFQAIPRPSCGGLDKSNYHLVTLQGCLSAVVSFSDGSNEIWMMKDYNVQTSWTKAFTIPNYVPRSFRFDRAPPFRATKNGHIQRPFRVLCSLKNQSILFLYRSRCLACYNPESKEFKDVNFPGLPVEFQAYVHVGSLISVNSAFNAQPGA